MNLSSSAEFIESISTKFSSVENEFDTLKIKVKPEEWVETAKILKEDFQLTYFSLLSAIDWEN